MKPHDKKTAQERLDQANAFMQVTGNERLEKALRPLNNAMKFKRMGAKLRENRKKYKVKKAHKRGQAI